VAERQAIVKLLPTGEPGPSILRRTCRRPRCGNEIDPPVGRSRPREFCSKDCQTRYKRERVQAKNTLLEAQRLACEYGIDVVVVREPPSQPDEAHNRTPSPPVSASYLALSLVAQALESIRVEIREGIMLSRDEVLARITTAKEEGDRLLRTYRPQDRL
jgi:hypothetical protein